MAQLRQEEFDLLIAEAAQLGAEDIVDANMLRIPTATNTSVRERRRGIGGRSEGDLRQVSYGEGGVFVEVLGLDETLEQVPAHGGCRIGGQSSKQPTLIVQRPWVARVARYRGVERGEYQCRLVGGVLVWPRGWAEWRCCVLRERRSAEEETRRFIERQKEGGRGVAILHGLSRVPSFDAVEGARWPCRLPTSVVPVPWAISNHPTSPVVSDHQLC